MPATHSFPAGTRTRTCAAFRAGTLLLLLVSVGCQSSGGSSWQFWRTLANDPNADLKDPERLHVAYGKLSEQTGDYSTARENYETALRQNGRAVEAILGLARLDLLANRPAEAESRFRKAVQIDPSSPVASEALGQFYITQNRYTEAAAELRRGIAIAPNNKRLQHRLGIALARGGNILEAEQHFVQAVGDAEADYNIGLILYEQGRIARAEQRFLQAVLKKPTLAPAQHWLDAVRQEKSAKSLLAQAPTRRNSGTQQNPPAQQASASQPAVSGRNAAGPGSKRISASRPSAPKPSASPDQAAGSDRNIVPTVGAAPPTSSQRSVRPGTSKAQTPNRVPTLNPATMTATQLEQLENSLSPAERAALRERLRNGEIEIR